MARKRNKTPLPSNPPDNPFHPDVHPSPTVSHQQTSMTYRREEFHGPLPPPSVLKGYDDVLPGAANRILELVEKQSNHRIGLEYATIHSDIRRANLGLICGFVVALSFLAASLFLITKGFELGGTILGTVDLVALVSAFIYGTIARKNERIQKHEISQARKRN